MRNFASVEVQPHYYWPQLYMEVSGRLHVFISLMWGNIHFDLLHKESCGLQEPPGFYREVGNLFSCWESDAHFYVTQIAIPNEII